MYINANTEANTSNVFALLLFALEEINGLRRKKGRKKLSVKNGYRDPFIKKIYNETTKSNESLWPIQKSTKIKADRH